MKNWFRKNLLNITVILLLILFGLFYWRTVMYLPLFGDATIHGNHAKILMEQGWQNLTATYPPLYYYMMDVLYSFFGEKGYNLLVYLGVFLIIIFSYLIAYQVSKRKDISFLIMFLAGFSPKLIFYSARLYQEILITAFFLICFYLFLKLQEKFNNKIFYLLLFLIGITLSIKQQGLLILYVAFVIFYFLQLILKKINLKKFLLVLFIPLIIGFGFYGILFHTKGKIVIGNEDYRILNIVNFIGQQIFNYPQDGENALNTFEEAYNHSRKRLIIDQETIAEGEVEELLKVIKKEKYKIGAIRARNRQTRFTDLISDFSKFNNIHNLYNNVFGYNGFVLFIYLFFFLLLVCLILFFLNLRKSDFRKKYLDIIIFFIIFLGINYFLFQRNTDQARYHLFIAFYGLFFIAYGLSKIKNKKIFIYGITAFLIVIISPVNYFFRINRGAENGQLYSSSIGGMKTVQETGNWLNINTKLENKIWQMCSNETKYYSRRNVTGNWQAYFLKIEDLKKYFQENNFDYIVIFQSQIVPDQKWTALCRMPKSFFKRINDNFQKIYTSSKGDIFVYKI